MSPTVLIVDDHAGFRCVAREILEADGYRVIAESAPAAKPWRPPPECGPR